MLYEIRLNSSQFLQLRERMGEKINQYQKMSKAIEKDLRKVLDKYNLDMDQFIDAFSVFLAKVVIEKSEDRVLDSLNIVHSFSRYVMALQIDEKNDIKNTF